MRYCFYPTKNVSISQSIIGISGLIVNIIKHGEKEIDELYKEYFLQYIETKKVKNKIDFSQFVLGLCFLYTIKVISIDEKGVIKYESS